MNDDQASRLKAIAQQHEPFFFLRVIRVIDQAGVFVQKNSTDSRITQRMGKGDAN
jgi:hypothetical protein